MRLLITIILLSFGSYNSYACDCLLQPIESDFKNIDYVVTAEVIELLDSKSEREEFHRPQNDISSYRVRIKITKSFKNGFEEGKIVELASQYTNCDPLFEMGETYLLFLYKKEDKFLEIPCTYWGKLSESQDNIKTITGLAKK